VSVSEPAACCTSAVSEVVLLSAEPDTRIGGPPRLRTYKAPSHPELRDAMCKL
jgi:hypothetical protein